MCSTRPKISLSAKKDKPLNFYRRRVETDEKIETLKKLAKVVPKVTTFESKCFPTVELRSAQGFPEP